MTAPISNENVFHFVAPQEWTQIPFPAKALKLLLNDFLHSQDRQQSSALGQRDDGDDLTDEDSGQWEDDDEESPFAPAEKYAHLQDLLAFGEEVGGDEANDEEFLKQDPLYSVDLKVYRTANKITILTDF